MEFIRIIFSLSAAFSMLAFSANAETKPTEYLIKVALSDGKNTSILHDIKSLGLKHENLTEEWVLVSGPSRQLKAFFNSKSSSAIEYVQPNYKISLMEKYELEDPLRRAALEKFLSRNPELDQKKSWSR